MVKGLINTALICGASLQSSALNLNVIQKAVSPETIWKNGANDFTSIYSTSIFYSEENVDKVLRLSVHAMPLEKEDYFKWFTSVSYNGYKEFYCSVPFKIAFSIAISDTAWTKFDKFEQVSFDTFETGANYFFRAYHLPDSYIGSYDYKTYITRGILNFTFENNEFIISLNSVLNTSTYNLRNINGTPVYTKYESNDTWTSEAFTTSTIKYDCSGLTTPTINAIKNSFTNQNNLSWSYNCSLSEEYLAYKTGYNDGRELAGVPKGLEWVRGAIKTLEGFLSLNFGFFTLGQLLGGFLVVAIVLFIFKRFR